MGHTGKDTRGLQNRTQFQGSMSLDDNLDPIPPPEGPSGTGLADCLRFRMAQYPGTEKHAVKLSIKYPAWGFKPQIDINLKTLVLSLVLPKNKYHMAFEFIWSENWGTLNNRAQFSTVTPQQRKGWQGVGACPWSGVLWL